MQKLTIQVDTREKARAIKKILAEFSKQDVKTISSKLFVGDYMSYDNPRLIIDRKQNLAEMCGNVCQQHKRFQKELLGAQENGIKLIFLVEHSNQIKSIDDVEKWQNPRRKKKVWIDDQIITDNCGNEAWEVGHWEMQETKAMTGTSLSKIMRTLEKKYGCEFMFCDKLHTGKRIIEILGGEDIDKGRN